MSGAAWAEAIREVHREAAGVLGVHFVRSEDAPALLVDSMLGDAHAIQLMRAVVGCLHAIRTAPKRTPTLCLACPRPIRKPDGAVFCVAIPDRPDASQGVGSALCLRCAAAPDRNDRAYAALRRIWPDLRPIEVTPGPGAVQ